MELWAARVHCVLDWSGVFVAGFVTGLALAQLFSQMTLTRCGYVFLEEEGKKMRRDAEREHPRRPLGAPESGL